MLVAGSNTTQGFAWVESDGDTYFADPSGQWGPAVLPAGAAPVQGLQTARSTASYVWILGANGTLCSRRYDATSWTTIDTNVSEFKASEAYNAVAWVSNDTYKVSTIGGNTITTFQTIPASAQPLRQLGGGWTNNQFFVGNDGVLYRANGPSSAWTAVASNVTDLGVATSGTAVRIGWISGGQVYFRNFTNGFVGARSRRSPTAEHR